MLNMLINFPNECCVIKETLCIVYVWPFALDVNMDHKALSIISSVAQTFVLLINIIL